MRYDADVVSQVSAIHQLADRRTMATCAGLRMDQTRVSSGNERLMMCNVGPADLGPTEGLMKAAQVPNGVQVSINNCASMV